ncbi:MAG: hypothetical protein ACRDQZ_12770 [Mycobacteriales bacterium]
MPLVRCDRSELAASGVQRLRRVGDQINQLPPETVRLSDAPVHVPVRVRGMREGRPKRSATGWRTSECLIVLFATRDTKTHPLRRGLATQETRHLHHSNHHLALKFLAHMGRVAR